MTRRLLDVFGLSMISDLPGDSFGGMVDVLNHPQSSSQEPPHGPYYANQSPFGNHFTALVVQLSSSLAHGADSLITFFTKNLPPQKMATFERALRPLLQEVGRRIMAWVLNHMEPERPEEMPTRLWLKGQAQSSSRFPCHLCGVKPTVSRGLTHGAPGPPDGEPREACDSL